jgi:hypothetical protein
MHSVKQQPSEPKAVKARGEFGQAMTEYVIMLCAIVIPLIPICNALLQTLQTWYTFVTTWVILPIP